jgi:predicted MPP superfamily phosphohydrolase
MLMFLSLAFLIYGGLHYYALSKVWQAFPHSVAMASGLVLWGIAMTFAPLLIWFVVKQGWHGAAAALSWVAYCWMGFVFLFCCIGLVLDMGGLGAGLAGFAWRLKGMTALLAIGLPALALAGYAFFEARQIRVVHLHFTSPKLASQRLTIAQISDLHLGLMLGDSFLDRVVAILRQEKPDMIVATGDILDGQEDNLAGLAPRFRQLAPPDGMYAVLGNHESFAGLDTSLGFLDAAGFTVLRGESRQAGGIMLAGVDDPALGQQRRDMLAATRRALAAARQHAFVVLLKHQPVVDDAVPFDLQLSGHAHGGQIFPFGIFTRLVYGVRAGRYEYDGGRTLYINRGAGTWGPPMRLLAPPEITLITLERGNGPQAP